MLVLIILRRRGVIHVPMGSLVQDPFTVGICDVESRCVA